MARRVFKWKLAIVLLIGVVVFGVTIFAIRQWQKSRSTQYSLTAGMEAYEEQSWEQAAQYLGRYISHNHEDDEVKLKYAQAQMNRRPMRSEHIQQAIASYRSILRRDPANLTAAKNTLGLHLGIGANAEAELIATRYLEHDDHAEVRQMLAMALFRQRDYAQAARQIKHVVTEFPDFVPAYETIAMFAENRGQDFEHTADYWLDRAVQLNPESAMAHIIRAKYFLRQGDLEQGLHYLETAEQFHQSEPAVLLAIAEAYLNLRETEKCEQYLELTKQVEPKNTSMWRLWARLARRSGQAQVMTEVADSALANLPERELSFTPLAAELYIHAGQYEKAAHCVDVMKRYEANAGQIAFLEGLIAERTEGVHQAIGHYRNAISLGHSTGQTRIALASALSATADYNSAADQLRSVISEEPENAAAHLELANLMLAQNQYDQAMDVARRALQLQPENPTYLHAYVRARVGTLNELTPEQYNAVRDQLHSQLQMLEELAEQPWRIKLLQFRVAVYEADFARAETILQQLQDSSAEPIESEMARAQLLLATNEHDQAIEHLEQTIANHPGQARPVELLTIVYLRHEQPDQAVELLRRTLDETDQADNAVQLSIMLADLYRHQGDDQAEYELLAELAEEAASNIELQRRLLQCSQVYTDLDRAQDIVDRIRTLESQQGWRWRYEQALLYFRQDDFQTYFTEIETLLQDNLRTNPDHIPSRRILAQSYAEAGLMQMAVRAYNEALSRSPNDMSIIGPALDVMARAGRHDRVDEIVANLDPQMLQDPRIQTFRLQSYMRQDRSAEARQMLEELAQRDPDNINIALNRAIIAARNADYEQADTLLAELFERDSENLPVISLWVRVKLALDDAEQAISLCDHAVENLADPQAHMLRAQTYIELGMTDRALQDYDAAVEHPEAPITALIARSMFHAGQGRVEQAISDLEQAAQIEPEDLTVSKLLIERYMDSAQQQRLDQARQMLEQALAENPEDTELKMLQGRYLLSDITPASLEQARALFDEVVSADPTNAQAWALLGEIALEQDQIGRAIDMTMRGLAANRNNRQLLSLKARAEARRSPSLAIPTMRTLYELDPADVATALRLAQLYVDNDQPDRAVTFIENLLPNIDDSQDTPRVKTALAMALQAAGRSEQALDLLQQQLSEYPNNPEPLLAFAMVMRDREDFIGIAEQTIAWYADNPDQSQTPINLAGTLAGINNDRARQGAEDILRAVVETDDNSAAAKLMLASLLQGQGLNDEPAQLYRQVLQINPNQVIAMNNLAWILAMHYQQFEEALELADTGLSIQPDYADLLDTRGVIHKELGKYDMAAEDFSRAVELYNDSAPAASNSLFNLAKVQMEKGDDQAAYMNLEKALETHERLGGLAADEVREAQQLMQNF